MKDVLKDIKQSLLTGVSYMIPFVIAGGILVAIGFAGGGAVAVTQSKVGFWSRIFWWGKDAFGMMIPILAAYIAYSIGDKPALLAGFVGGIISNRINGGFFAALIAGILAGYIVQLLKKIKVPTMLRSLLPILIIPVLSTLAIGFLMEIVLGGPVTFLNTAMLNALSSLNGGSLIILGIIQGAMLAFDLGGPVNKAAYAFALATMAAGNNAPMAANFIASMTPPLSLGIAMLIAKKKFTKEETSATSGCIVGGLSMISEFAIPFAAGNPLLYVPCFMGGSAVGAVLSYLFGLTMQAPHGGYFVVFLCNKPILFTLALIIGSLVSAALIVVFKKIPVEIGEDEKERVVNNILDM